MQRYRSLDSNPIRFIVDAVGTIQKKNPLAWVSGRGGREQQNKLRTTETHAKGFFVLLFALPHAADLSLGQG